MKTKKSSKTITLVKYSLAWLATIGVGFACWGIILMFDKIGYLYNQRTSFWFGFLAGILGMLCYSMVWQMMTPVVQWAWGKIRHTHKDFIELVNGKAMTSRVDMGFKKQDKA